MDIDQLKRTAAQAALVDLGEVPVVGIGTGSTVEQFIELLAALDLRPATVASSERTAARLRDAGLPLLELASAPRLPVYVDGADEVDPDLNLIKGRGGAHTREKIMAWAAERFVCIVDESKLVLRLGRAPVPVEVLPAARAPVERRLAALGGRARLREGVVSDQGNLLLDVTGLDLSDPSALELELDALPGVLASGLFARRRPDLVLAAGPETVRRLAPR
jgi:ribose 5-phosphate isomerase A